LKNQHSIYVTLREGIVTIATEERSRPKEDVCVWFTWSPIIEMTKDEQDRSVVFFNSALSSILERSDVGYIELGDFVEATAAHFIELEDDRNAS
jgi:hypothetical protein